VKKRADVEISSVSVGSLQADPSSARPETTRGRRKAIRRQSVSLQSLTGAHSMQTGHHTLKKYARDAILFIVVPTIKASPLFFPSFPSLTRRRKTSGGRNVSEPTRDAGTRPICKAHPGQPGRSISRDPSGVVAQLHACRCPWHWPRLFEHAHRLESQSHSQTARSKPGTSLTMIAPSQPAAYLTYRRYVSSLVRFATTISSRRMIGRLKKCMPTTFSGRAADSAIAVMDSEEYCSQK